MALSGTLKDFSIADILQLIGHQTKTGRLTLKTGTDEVEVFFVDGNVVFASEKSRDSRDLLGSLLLRAELVSKERLDDALAIQQRTLKRLGDILVDNASVTHAQLAQMMRLQTTETLYKLFSWKNGSYEFSQETVDAAKSTFEPIRSESVLLEGFRRMDEWPALKRNVPWTDATFETLKELDTAGLQSIDDGLDDGHGEDGQPAGRHKLVYKLATLGKNVQQILDISRLGEFEALKALNQLIEWEYLRAVPAGPVKVLAEGIRKGRRLTMSWAGALVRLAITLTCFGATLLLVRSVAPGLGTSRAEGPARRGVIARLIARDQVARLESALEVYRTEHGEYPPALRALLEGELVSEHDLRYPWKEPYYYRRTAQGFVLLPPLD